MTDESIASLDSPQADLSGLSLFSSIPVYSNAVVALYRQRQEIPAHVRTPWSGYVWERCKAELGDDVVPPDVPDEAWTAAFSLWECSGRAKKLWPTLGKVKRARKDLAQLADRALDTKSLALELGLQEMECPSCRSVDAAMKHYTNAKTGLSEWKHHRSCGAFGRASKLVELVLGREAALTYLADRVGGQSLAPVEWPQPDMRGVADDPDDVDDGDDAEGEEARGKHAWFTALDMAKLWASCRHLTPLPFYSSDLRVLFKGNVLTAPADVRVCTVNCEGVMGKGVARAFRDAYPGLFDAYKAHCAVRFSSPGVVDTDTPPDPEGDGVTHINVYSQGKTALGRFASNFEDCGVDTEDGRFASVEGYWYFLLAKPTPARESLRNLSGTEAKRVGRTLPQGSDMDSPEFQRKVSAALAAKFRSNPEMLQELRACKLPLDHYYVFDGVVKRASRHRWVLDAIDALRAVRQTGGVRTTKRVHVSQVHDLCATRPSFYGNPWSHLERSTAAYKVGTRDEAIDVHERWLREGVGPAELAAQRAEVLRRLPALRGKRIACVCGSGERCHVDTLAQLADEFRPGSVFRWDAPDGTIILCVATKDAWKDPSTYAWIEAGAAELRRVVDELAERNPRLRVVMPALGCQNGGLDWERVRARLELAFRRCSVSVVAYAPGAETRETDAVDDPVVRYVESRGFDLSRLDARSVDSTVEMRRGVADLLAQAPALATPIRDNEGVIRNLQLRFVRGVSVVGTDGKVSVTKTRFVNGGNPGATEDADGRPYAYGAPHRLDGAVLGMLLEGGPDTHTGHLVLREMSRTRAPLTHLREVEGLCTDTVCRVPAWGAHTGPCEPCGCGGGHAIDECPLPKMVAVGALDAGHMPALARLVHECATPPQRILVVPHLDAAKTFGPSDSSRHRTYSVGVEAGDALLDALLFGDLPGGAYGKPLPEGDGPLVLVGTGHRPDKIAESHAAYEAEGYHDKLKALAVQLIRRIQALALATGREVRGISGMALGWDQALADAFRECGLWWTAALPCDGQDSRWPAAARERWRMLCDSAAERHVVCPGPYREGVLQARNEWMAKRAGYTLALYDGTPGGTANYLRANKSPVFNVWKVWARTYRVWDWYGALRALGLEQRDGWDENDVLRAVGIEAFAREVERQLV